MHIPSLSWSSGRNDCLDFQRLEVASSPLDRLVHSNRDDRNCALLGIERRRLDSCEQEPLVVVVCAGDDMFRLLPTRRVLRLDWRAQVVEWRSLLAPRNELDPHVRRPPVDLQPLPLALPIRTDEHSFRQTCRNSLGCFSVGHHCDLALLQENVHIHLNLVMRTLISYYVIHKGI